ncbi:hypothetical protein DAEQUDRAFT_762941 [Daedalea quercina L-15889]|uniref:Uncharacterized protein n=1 Tax=Daedalea quercina L-15889 TaxID=1314783 RepID=A0A165SYH8_9APHY|nr:hypothetical protein DAEQUDRAFT_762941 [Daedalea quercina L-15889]
MEGDDELDQLEDEVTDLDHVYQPFDKDIPRDIQSPPAVSTKSMVDPRPEPASIRSRPHSRAKHSIPTPHKSRVMRSLNSLGTKLAAEWAEAIDNYVDVLSQSAAKANAPKAKKLLLKAKWAMGNMYEARCNIRTDIVADSGAAAAVTRFSDLRTHADWSRDAIALWERAVEIAECWRKRFIPEDER